MKILQIQLTHFRNYASFELEFGNNTTVLVGENAVGKTNVLEAVYLLATGDSFRATKIEEMVRWGVEVGHVIGEILISPKETRYKKQDTSKSQITNYKREESDELRVTLTRGEVQGKRTAKRRYLVNGVGRRKMDFVGNLMVVKFIPEDLQLVIGSPSRRRGYLDEVLMQVDREYRRSLLSYEKGLRRRNKLLDLIRDGKTQRSALMFWDSLVVKEGEIVQTKRQELIDFVNAMEPIDARLRMEYDSSVITEKKLERYKEKELMAGYTLIGPHKDDWRLLEMNGSRGMDLRDLAIYGSRGEQRMGILWLKMAELAFMEQATSSKPVLLLDDIFSELDNEHDSLVMQLLDSQQTLVTTTDEDERFGKVDDLKVVRLQ